jgi:streptogramin lyase
LTPLARLAGYAVSSEIVNLELNDEFSNKQHHPTQLQQTLHFSTQEDIMNTTTLRITSTTRRNACAASFKRASTNAALLGLALLVNPVTSAVAATGQITEFVLPVVPGVGSAPQGIAAGSDGNLWAAEFGTSKIARITPAGIIKEFPLATGALPLGIAAGPDGNLWFTPRNGIGRITPSGVVTIFPLSTIPHQITAGPDGNVWFTDWFRGNIGRITPLGVITLFPIPTRPGGGSSQPIAAGPDGNIWFTESNAGAHKIGRITRTGVITEFPVPTPGVLGGITAGPDGNMWFTEDNNPGVDKIGKITPAGVITEISIPTVGDPQPQRIAAGADGNLWFTERQGNKVARMTPLGVVTEFTIATLLSGPWGLTAGPDGNIWFTEGKGNIGRLLATAANTTYALHLPSGFVAKTKAVSQGQTLVWVDQVAGLSAVKQNNTPPIFDLLPRGTGSTSSFRFPVAGTYAYKDPLHATHTGTVTVAPKVSPARGTVATNFVITWATGTGNVVPLGWVMDVQMKAPGSKSFTPWQTNVLTKAATFTPTAGIGVYQFQARMRLPANATASGWSPAASITVS